MPRCARDRSTFFPRLVGGAVGPPHASSPSMRFAHVILVSLAASAASACLVTPVRTRTVVVQDTDGDGDGDDVVVVDSAPPVVQNELVGTAPYPGAIWINGYWGWQANRHYWVAGHWDRPRVGYVYRPHRWVHRHGRWHLKNGGWHRHH